MIESINNYTIYFAAKVLESKLLHNMCPDQCTAGEIALYKICTEGVHINWCQFLLNELLQDAIDAHEKGRAFHYSWMLILISFIAWSDPPKYQGVYLPVNCKGVRYQNLWFEKEKKEWQT